MLRRLNRLYRRFSCVVASPHQPSGRQPRAGYSMLEILVVLAIIALIAAVVGPRLFAQLDKSKTQTARLQIRSLEAALETMRIDIGRLPTEQEGLTLLMKADAQQTPGWSGPYLDKDLPPDPWGRSYIYVAPPAPSASEPTPDARARVISYGADGQEGGEGVNADVSSDSAR
ncbi:type II secretion system major pseudopilin GspG [Brevundimonas guildfordensis]|jgi:general secretion pathway protein G|uniref:Type II secretion system core protein G n=1 Tax=Brevundimonas guildfordensis TaxID=2762241 RepID=A0ABR8R0W1_9CAUL|nr:type II secretion system major pseudopilin GspG [Brevundimonas guildfordensis]MBD7941337.1 type II secretion system major pseudopilin GspG [Brevundimonas guildfordensis]